MLAEDQPTTKKPIDNRGQFVSRKCPDKNCDGELVYGGIQHGQDFWHCNGLTHVDDEGELIACEHAHYSGDPKSA